MMIWLLFSCMCFVVALYICAPLYSPAALSADTAPEVRAYLDEILELEQRMNGGEASADIGARKLELERQIARQSKAGFKSDHGLSRGLTGCIFAVLLAGGFGLYGLLGRPEMTQVRPMTEAPTANIESMSLEALTAQLEDRLRQNPSQPEGWLLYARSLIQLSRYDESVRAYEMALAQSGNDEDVGAELSRARDFIAVQTGASGLVDSDISGPQIIGPSQEDVEAAAQLSDEDRTDFINSMVEGLALRLQDKPDDAAGWIRLLGARGVLGQSEKIAADVEFIKVQFKDEPETLQLILDAANAAP